MPDSEITVAILRNDLKAGTKGAAVQRGDDGKHHKYVSVSMEWSKLAERIRDPKGPIAVHTNSTRPLYNPDEVSGGKEYESSKKKAISVLPAVSADAGTPVLQMDIKHHNGKYGFDIDDGDLDVDAAYDALKAWEHTFVLGRSMSGSALWLVANGPIAASHEEYKHNWHAITERLPNDLKANNGRQSNNLNRERFLAHDPDLYLNPEATPIELPTYEPKSKSNNKGRAKPKADDTAPLTDEQLSWLTDNLHSLPTEHDYNAWIGRLTALKAAGVSMADADRWSARGTRYTAGEVDERWDGLQPSETPHKAFNVLRKAMRQNGAPPQQGDSKRTIIQSYAYDRAGFVECLEIVGCEYRYNKRGLRNEFKERDSTWKRETDRHAANLRSRIAEQCLQESEDKSGNPKYSPVRYGDKGWKNLMNSHLYDHEVDPFALWRDHLPKWDGEKRLDGMLEELFVIAPNQPQALVVWASRYPMLCALARAETPGLKVDESPVLVGPRGIGKSTWIQRMPPPTEPEWFVDRLRLTATDKEIAEKLEQRVLVEMTEMAGSRSADVEHLKSILSGVDDGGQRGAYRFNPEAQPRLCAIVGTTNRRDSLPNDLAGNRNFAVVELDSQKSKHPGTGRVIEYMEANRLQLWAEALDMLNAGIHPRLPDELADIQAEHNETYRSADYILEDKLAMYLKQHGSDLILQKVAEDLKLVDEAGRLSKPEQARLTDALRLFGYQPRKGAQGRRVWRKS